MLGISPDDVQITIKNHLKHNKSAVEKLSNDKEMLIAEDKGMLIEEEEKGKTSSDSSVSQD